MIFDAVPITCEDEDFISLPTWLAEYLDVPVSALYMMETEEWILA